MCIDYGQLKILQCYLRVAEHIGMLLFSAQKHVFSV